MDKCRYYETSRSTIQRRPIPIGKLYPPQTSEVPWCSHPNSPLKKNDAMLLGAKLTCGGDLSKCPIGYQGD